MENEIDVEELGDAMVETKQVAPGAFYMDSTFAFGVRPNN